MSQDEILSEVAAREGWSANEAREAWATMLGKYAPNPPMIKAIHELRDEFGLVLFNNGCPQSFDHWVNQFELGAIFDVVTNSRRIGVAKPDPRAFDMASAMIGLTPQRVIVIDDDAEIIAAAKQQGLRTFHYDARRGLHASEIIAILRGEAVSEAHG